MRRRRGCAPSVPTHESVGGMRAPGARSARASLVFVQCASPPGTACATVSKSPIMSRTCPTRFDVVWDIRSTCGTKLFNKLQTQKNKKQKRPLFFGDNGYLSHLRPSSAFYAHFTRPRSTTRPNAVWTTYIQQPTDWHLLAHCSMGRAQWTRHEAGSS